MAGLRRGSALAVATLRRLQVVHRPCSPAASLVWGSRQQQRAFGSVVVGGAVPAESESKEGGVRTASNEVMELEYKYSAHNYHPLPVVFSRAKGESIWDPEGRQYLDFLSAYSAVNQGHCHPKIVAALMAQSQELTLSSRAFYNDKFPAFAKLLTETFGYDMVLPMNTGAEGVETALKLAKKWGYLNKGIPDGQALVVSCCGCFHGRTLAAISMSCDNEATRGFYPLVPGQLKVDFGDIDGLQRILEEHSDRICAFLLEPIQGEAGVVVPPDGYMREVRELCTKHNVLMVADEIQTGIARTGRMLACDWEEVRPDVVILGKALGGGVFPVSAVLADADVMLCIQPGEHGSTFGGNPIAAAVGTASLEVVLGEKLPERSASLGEEFREQLRQVQSRHPHAIAQVRGRGLLNAIVMDQEGLGKATAFDVCLALKERGILAKPTHDTIIRLSPPLTISQKHLTQCAEAFEAVMSEDLPLLQQTGSANKDYDPQPCDRCGRVLYKMPETDL